MFVLGEKLTEPKAQEISKEITAQVKKEGATIEKEIYWGKKKLAYKIADNSFGYYFMVIFTAEGQALEKLTRELNLNERISRYLITEYLEGVELPGAESAEKAEKGEQKETPSSRTTKRTGGEETVERKTARKIKKEESKDEKTEESQDFARDRQDDEKMVVDTEKSEEAVEEPKKEPEKEKIDDDAKPISDEERKATLDKKLAEILGEDISADL